VSERFSDDADVHAQIHALPAVGVAVPFSCLYEPGPTRRWLKVKQSGTVAEDRWRQRISTGA